MRKAFATSILAACMALPAAAAAQTVLTFEDIGGGLSIPAPYNGLTFSSFLANFPGSKPPGGYANGITSGQRYVFSLTGATPTITSATPFTLNGGYFTAGWLDGLQLRVVGSLGAAQLYDATFSLNTSAPTYLDLDYAGIDRVAFTTTGGTPVPGFTNTTSRQFAIDDLAINGPTSSVPEPGTYALLATGLIAIGAVARRRSR